MKNKFLLIGFLILPLTGCQMNYLLKSSYSQMKLLWKRQRIETALLDPKISAETKGKMTLVQEAKRFAENKIGLTSSRNYETFVMLDGRHVVHLVTASAKNELQAYTWRFPIVGKVPYKGFFNKEDALKEKDLLEAQDLDVYIRGVSAYSTLGWFSDPLLSSMTYYDDEDLVETVIHELTHGTLFIKSNVDFNERLATFVGNKGMEQFYMEREGAHSATVLKSRMESADSRIFAEFISKEIKDIEGYYEKNKKDPDLKTNRQARLDQITVHFEQHCRPKLKTKSFDIFSKLKLNNAILIGYKTYYQDLEVFERAFQKANQDWKTFFDKLKTLKSSSTPEKDLQAWLSS